MILWLCLGELWSNELLQCGAEQLHCAVTQGVIEHVGLLHGVIIGFAKNIPKPYSYIFYPAFSWDMAHEQADFHISKIIKFPESNDWEIRKLL